MGLFPSDETKSPDEVAIFPTLLFLIFLNCFLVSCSSVSTAKTQWQRAEIGCKDILRSEGLTAASYAVTPIETSIDYRMHKRGFLGLPSRGAWSSPGLLPETLRDTHDPSPRCHSNYAYIRILL